MADDKDLVDDALKASGLGGVADRLNKLGKRFGIKPEEAAGKQIEGAADRLKKLSDDATAIARKEFIGKREGPNAPIEDRTRETKASEVKIAAMRAEDTRQRGMDDLRRSEARGEISPHLAEPPPVPAEGGITKGFVAAAAADPTLPEVSRRASAGLMAGLDVPASPEAKVLASIAIAKAAAPAAPKLSPQDAVLQKVHAFKDRLQVHMKGVSEKAVLKKAFDEVKLDLEVMKLRAEKSGNKMGFTAEHAEQLKSMEEMSKSKAGLHAHLALTPN
jgi:hypothetical protein